MKTSITSHLAAFLLSAGLVTWAQSAPVYPELPFTGTVAQIETQDIDFPFMAVDGLGTGHATLLGRYIEHEIFPEVNLITGTA